MVALSGHEPAPRRLSEDTGAKEACAEHTGAGAVPPRVNVGSAVKVPLSVLALVAAFGMLDYAQQLFLPLTLAFIISLTLSPVNRWLSRRMPAGVSALLLVVAVTAALIAIVAGLSQPVSEWIDDAPRIGWRLQQRFAEIREPVEAVTEASKQVEEIANVTEDETVTEVVVREPGLIHRAANNLGEVATTLILAIAMTYFLLASNRMLYEKLVRASPKLKDKKRSISIVYRIENIVSRYLLTITVINACFGLTIGVVMWLLGMPSPVMWGVAAMFLNYLPFVGSAVGTISTGLVALVTFDSLWWALIPPVAYFSITTTEGQFITPAVLGQRLELNPVAILTSIAFWGFLWGVAGVILAVPILIVMKVFSDNIEAMAGLGEFLSGSPLPIEEEPRPQQQEVAPNLPSAS